MVSSCAKEHFTENDCEAKHKSGQVVSLFATTQPVKTANDGLNTKWVAEDALNVFHAETGATEYGSNDEFSIDPENIETGRFLGTLSTPLEAEKSYDWYVLYPYDSHIKTPANPTSGYMPIGSSGKSEAQVQNGNNSTAHLCGQYFPLYGKATNVKKGDTPSISMSQALCVVKIQVTNNSTEPFAVTSVSFEAKEDITGTYYIDFSGDTPGFKSSGASYVSNIVNLTVNDGEDIAVGGTADFYLAVKPFTAAKGTSLDITVNGMAKTVSIPDTKDVEFKPGTIKKISYSYAPPAPVAYTLVTSLNDIEEGDYIITNENYALQNTFTTSAPSVTLSSSFGTVAEGVFTTSSTQCVWTFTGDSYESMTIRPYGSETDFLYATSNNNGLRVGDTSDTWCFETNNGVTNGFSMKAKNSRYCAVYVDTDGPKDWRTYTSAQHTNYKLNKGALLLYKVASTTPKIIPGDDIVAPATGIASGALTYTVKNFEDDVVPSYTGCVTAAAINTKGTVTYTVAPNYTLDDAEGTITLTSASTGATATVNVSQAASVFEVVADDPVVIGNKAEDEGSFTIKSTFEGSLAISDSENFIINETYEAKEEGATVTIVAVNDGAATDREATITVTRQGQESVVVNILQNKQGAQPLAVPSDVAVTTHTTSKIAAEWTGDGNASSYDWIISTETTAVAAESNYVKNGNTEDTSIEVEDTFATGTYYFYVRSASSDQTLYITSDYTSIDFEIKEQHSLTVDFEKVASAYKLWEFTNAESQQTYSGVDAHGGSYFGTTGGKASASIQTKDKIANPVSINFFISKQTTNTSTSNWKVEVSSDKSNWTAVGDAIDATSMTKGTWVNVNRALSSYSNVYVRVSYSGSTATRNIDDLVLTYEGSEIKEPELTSIAVKTSSHRNFTQGDDFVKETIEATYSNTSTSDVTEAATFSGYDMSTVGEQTVTVTYAEGGIEKSTTYTINVTAGGGEEVSGVLASWTFTSGTAGTNYPSNETDFANNGSDDLASGTFYLNGSGSQWNTTKGYAFTAVTDITITVKAKKTLKKGAKITFSMDTFYNKATNAPMKGFDLKAAEGSATASATGLSATSFSLSTSSDNKSVDYTLQNDVAKDGTVRLVLTGTGKAGSGQGFISNIIAKYTAN